MAAASTVTSSNLYETCLLTESSLSLPQVFEKIRAILTAFRNEINIPLDAPIPPKEIETVNPGVKNVLCHLNLCYTALSKAKKSKSPLTTVPIHPLFSAVFSEHYAGRTFDRIKVLGKGTAGSIELVTLSNERGEKTLFPLALKTFHSEIDEGICLYEIEMHLIAANIDSVAQPIFAWKEPSSEGGSFSYKLLMEYVGPSLHTLIRRKCEIFSFEKSVHFLESLLTETAAFHRNILYHNDLHPGNLAVTHDGKCRIFDFTLADFISPSYWAKRVPSYSSYEIGALKITAPASDTWMLGIAMLFVLSGSCPWSDEQIVELFKLPLEEFTAKINTLLCIFYAKYKACIERRDPELKLYTFIIDYMLIADHTERACPTELLEIFEIHFRKTTLPCSVM